MAEPPVFFTRVKGKVSEVGDAQFKFCSADGGTEVAVILTLAGLTSPKHSARSLIIRSNRLLIGVGESALPSDAFPDLASDLPF